jgi:uncharacterized protein YdhG (YjbR/CyaY superfamily)
MIKYSTIDSYIAAQDPGVQDRLTTLRDLVHHECPNAVESVSYGMPAYKYQGKPLIYFAAFAHHIGVYATPSANIAFAQQLSGYIPNQLLNTDNLLGF